MNYTVTTDDMSFEWDVDKSSLNESKQGVSFMEDVPIWHYRSPSPAEYLQALAELDGDRNA